MRALVILALLFMGIVSSTIAGETIAVAAAADLAFCLDDLDAAFQTAHPGVTVQPTTGSSGNFFAQIQNGAPFDVFLSADLDYPRKLADAGFADAASLTPYATGRLVLWALKPDFDMKRGLKLLGDNAVQKIAIANPDHAPYGRAAKAALQHEGLWDALQPKIVLGENIAQTLQFVQSGNADVGLVARSLALSPKLAGQGHFVEIPEELHPRLEQGAILTKRGAAKPDAKAYLEFLRGPEARTIMARFGFGPPPEK
ncbi:MAG TPA: molybdate ABC transporter substrate-binding protein [Chthoniobacteraceae bacterium]|jgi:molybdate transport system substrate-binding protein